MASHPTSRLRTYPFSFQLTYRGKENMRKFFFVAEKINRLMVASLLSERLSNRLHGIEIAFVASSKDTCADAVDFVARPHGDFAVVRTPAPPQASLVDSKVFDAASLEYVIKVFSHALRMVKDEVADQSLCPTDRHSEVLQELVPFLRSLVDLSEYDAAVRIREKINSLPPPSDALTLERLESRRGMPKHTRVQGIRILSEFRRGALFPYAEVVELAYETVLRDELFGSPNYSEIFVCLGSSITQAVQCTGHFEGSRLAPQIFDLTSFEQLSSEERITYLRKAVELALLSLAERDGLSVETTSSIIAKVALYDETSAVRSLAAQYLPSAEGTTEELLVKLQAPDVARGSASHRLTGMPRFRERKVA